MKKLCLLALLLATAAPAEIYITVSGANVKRAKLALGQVHPLPDAGTGVDPQLAKNIRSQLRSDLEFTALFDFLSEPLFQQFDAPSALYDLKYENWVPIGGSFVLKIGYKIQSGKLILEGLLYDIPGTKKVFGTRYQFPVAQYPKLVHALTEDILKALTGEKGLFSSRLVMSCMDRRRNNPPKDIYMVDPDGRNLIRLTNDNTLTLSPSWAPDGKHITYTQFEFRLFGRVKKKGIVLKMHDLQSGDRQVLAALEGMTGKAEWAPNNSKTVVTMSFSGRPELYFIDPTNPGGTPDPLSRKIQWKKAGTEGFQSGLVDLLFDVEPSWAPDSKRIVFSSRRSGQPHIYIVDTTTLQATRLTFAGTYNSSPAWSPKGDKILFATQLAREGHFDLYLIDADGNNLQRVTSGEKLGRRVHAENPSWAPTGRHFAYASNEGGNFGIWVSTLDGSFKKKISPGDKECYTPSWGPYEGQ